MPRANPGLCREALWWGSIMTHRIAALALGCVALGGCASFDGIQEPVMASDVAVQTAVGSYGLATTLERIERETDKKAYRNRVISIWLLAIDTRYDAFRRDLSRGRKGANVGLDMLTLGLTSAGAIWDGAASELSALATGVGGTRASLDRELYFEKTLPVLISYMDAERLSLRGAIMEGMAKPIGDYPLEQGFSDLWRYQSAGSLDRAIGKAAEGAAEQVAEAEYDYSQAVELCLPTQQQDVRRRSLYTRMIAGVPADESAVPDEVLARANRGAALAGKSAVATDAALATKLDQIYAASDHLNGLCKESELDAFEAAVFGGGS